MRIELRADPARYLEKNLPNMAQKKSPWDLFASARIYRFLGLKEGLTEVAQGMEKSDPVSGAAFVIAGLRTCGQPTSSRSIQVAAKELLAQQHPDGGWGSEKRSVTFETAWCLSGLFQADSLPAKIQERAAGFLQKAQNEDGGWTNYDVGGKGRSCHGITPSCLWDGCGLCDLPDLRGSGMVQRAVGFILGLQKDDGGWADDPLVTRLSTGALAKAGLTLDSKALVAAVEWLGEHQNPDGSWAKDVWDTMAVLETFRDLGVEWKLSR